MSLETPTMSQKTTFESQTAQHISVGKLGEALACRYLVERGYTLRERNYRQKWGEIDVIAQKDTSLHFVEVKTMSIDIFQKNFGVASKFYIRPEEHLDARKIKRLERAIHTYLLQNNIPIDSPWQCDLLAIELDEEEKTARCRLYACISLV